MIAVRAVACSAAGHVATKQKTWPGLARSSSIQHARTICRSQFAEQLLPGIAEYAKHVDLTDYGHTLKWNKDRLKKVVEKHQLSEERWALLVAMAMQETNHMDWRERDNLKDGALNPQSRNASCFNLNIDLIQKSGWYSDNHTPGQFTWLKQGEPELKSLNSDSDEGLYDAVGILNCGFDAWGIEDTLAFVRRGGDAFDPCSQSFPRPAGARGWWRVYWDHQQYNPSPDPRMTPKDYRQMVWDDVIEYFKCIKRMLHFIDDKPELKTNELRPDIDCKHLDEPDMRTQ